MSLVKTILDTHVPLADRSSIPRAVLDMFRKVRQQWQEHAQVINGRIEFGNPTSGPVNISGVWQKVTTPATANTDFTVVHNLGRVAAGVTRMQSVGAACDVYVSSSDPGTSTTQVVLRASASSVPVVLFII